MVNLDSTAHEYASKMSNFSEFVRQCIRFHMDDEDPPYLQERIEDLQRLLEDVKNGRRYWNGTTWMVVE